MDGYSKTGIYMVIFGIVVFITSPIWYPIYIIDQLINGKKNKVDKEIRKLYE